MTDLTQRPDSALLRPLTTEQLYGVLAERVVKRVRDRTAHQTPPAEGRHCMRVTNLPDDVMRSVVSALAAQDEDTIEAVLLLGHKRASREPWQVSATRLIELRNASEGRPLIAFIPPGLKAAAEDSFDVSTFVEIDMRDLPKQIADDLLPPEVKPIVAFIDKKKPLDSESRMRYALMLQSIPHPNMLRIWAGAALYQLGLIPDFGFLSGGDWQMRIERNLAALKTLNESTQTLRGRILSLKLQEDTLQNALHDFLRMQSLQDVRVWGERIATDPAYRDLAFDRWQFQGEVVSEDVTIVLDDLDLPPPTNKINNADANLLYFDVERGTSFQVKWETNPKPLIAAERGLEYFRVQLVDSSGEPVWQSKNIKVGTSNRAARSFKLTKKDFGDLIEDGVYYVRVCAYDSGGEDITRSEPRDPRDELGKKINESEDVYFWIDPNGEPPPADPQRSTRVSGLIEARMYAQSAALTRGGDPFALQPQAGRTGWMSDKKAKRQEAIYNIVYDAQMRYTVSMSTLLRRIESDALLANPDSLGRYHLDLSTGLADRAEPHPRANLPTVPRSFRKVRTELFDAVRGADGLGLIALVDLLALDTLIVRYVDAYLDWLREAERDALDIDVIEVVLPTDDRRHVTVLLMAPTHPLRLLWQLQRAQVAAHWVRRAVDEGLAKGLSFRGDTAAVYLFKRLLPLNLPPILWLNDAAYIEVEPLTPFWGAYFADSERDVRAVRTRLTALLGLTESALTIEEESAVLFAKLRRYLEIHPYITTLTLNAFNVGDGAALVAAILALEVWRSDETNPLPDLRYRLQLFSHDASQLSVIGEAVDLLVSPERQVTDEADVFTLRSRNPLFPKLRYSRNTLEDFRKYPERFEADVTLCYDLFSPQVAFADVPGWRSSFVHGLVQSSVERFEDCGEETRYIWHRYLSPVPTLPFDERFDLNGRITEILEEIARAQAADSSEAARPVVALDLSVADMSLIQQMHSLSNWVITIDRHLGIDYFDSLPVSERPLYLLDDDPTLDRHSLNRVLVSTRFVEPAVDHIKLPPPRRKSAKSAYPLDVQRRIFERLRQISGRLGYKALASDAANDERKYNLLMISLTDLLLEQFGQLAGTLIIPLDSHPELFGHEDKRYLVQSMLLLVAFDPPRRRVSLQLVDMHWFSSAPRPLDVEERENKMKETFDQMAARVQELFTPDEHALDDVVREKRLITLLTYYLEHARRYRRITFDQADRLRAFIESLDTPFTIDLTALGVFFNPAQADGFQTRDPHGELRFVTLGADAIHALINDEPLEGDPIPATKPTPSPVDGDERLHETEAAEQSVEFHHLPVLESTPEPVADTAPSVNYDILLGGDGETPQYGLLGVTASGGKKIAVDLNTTNTICLFGAQGSGKSYTVGTVAEMATQSFTAINVLPAPLATVIFHYHESQDYPPEFISMGQPNRAPSDVKRLLDEYGASVGAIKDVLLMAPRDKVAERQAEFPGITVAPITFSSAELTIDSWRFLMGTSGTKTVYEKAINQIMRQVRNDIRLETLSEQIETSPLSAQQKDSARLRLGFAGDFIDDSRRLGDAIQPRRLVIVDLRDELIDKQEALGLFVVMLKIFADAGKGAFNKLVVFDEAHKYMNNDDLSESILSAIRQMRHQGVSLLIASQDPASLPNSIIELASMVVMHRFNAPSWLNHMRKSITALKQLDPARLAKLKTGEAYVWAARSTDPRWTDEPRLVQMRPRITAHGGGTQTAL